jgi:hypothetical protein
VRALNLLLQSTNTMPLTWLWLILYHLGYDIVLVGFLFVVYFCLRIVAPDMVKESPVKEPPVTTLTSKQLRF